MSKEDLWLYKTAALLHDPPDKAWVITRKISVPEVLRKHDKSIKAHEDRAWQLGDKILKEINLNKAVSDYKTYFFSTKITHADIFAAGVDRQLLYSVIPEEKIHELVKSWRFKQIFDPSKEIQEKVDELVPSENDLNDIIKDLNDILKEVKNSKYAYFTLYALYEFIWIYHNLPISPSDTRMPTHSVFDHNYATATTINFFIASQSETPEGLVITIDIPGVQEYISASRKLRDLRISSYLVSLIAWKIVEEFINLYGPDILILPTARFNPFFYTYLLGILNKEIKDTKKLKDIFKFMKLNINITDKPSEIEIISEAMFPRFSVIPPTITFVLPPIQYLVKDEEFIQLMQKYGINELNKEKLKELVKRIFEKIWLRIYEVIKESANKITNERYKLIKNIINNLDSIRDKYNFEKPPFDLRIIIIDIKEDIISKGISDHLKIYGTIFDIINIELSRFKHLKADTFTKTNLTELTTKIYKEEDEYRNLLPSGRAFDYCTVCGKLPAVLNVTSSKKITMYKLEEPLNENFEPYFAESEKICPYCLIKRIITIPIELDKERTIFESILNEFFNKLGFKFDIRVPSLADISTYEFKEKILDAIPDKIPLNEIKKIEEIVGEDIKTEEIEKIGFKPIHYVWKYPEKASDKLNRKTIDERTKAILETVFLRKESEMIVLKNNERKRKWSNFAKDYGINILPGTYYVLIRSDADNMGKIVSGEAFLPLSLDINYDEREKIRKDCLKEYLKRSYNLQDIIDDRELENKLTMLINSMNINSVISFSYHSSVSKSLMINSLIDNAIVEEFDGFTIYAGGDDLLVISPVSQALKIINHTSKNFQNGNRNGFYQIGTNYFIPALLTGRSYVMYIAHYMHPMYAIINSSNRYLDEFSKESKWSISGKEYESKCGKSSSLTKNSLTLVYSPRGSETYAILPLYKLDKLRMDKQDDKDKNILDILSEIIEDLINEKYSTRLIYNLIEKENLKTWDILMTKNKNDLLKEDIIKNVVEHHMKIPKEEKENKIKAFNDYINLINNIHISKEGLLEKNEKWLLMQLFKAVRVYWGGLRGV